MSGPRITYVTVPVYVDDGEGKMSLSPEDDGMPGLWGDTYVYGTDDGEGEDWVFDPEAQEKAWAYVWRLLTNWKEPQ